MSDKESTTAAPQADAATPQTPAVPAGPTISSEDRTTIINQINVQVNGPERRGNGGGGQRQARRNAGTTGQRNQGQDDVSPGNATPTPRLTTTPTRAGDRNNAPVEQDFDREGNPTRAIADAAGGRVYITQSGNTTRVVFSDAATRFTTQSDRAGFRGFDKETQVIAGNPRTDYQDISATPGVDGIWGLRGNVACEDRGYVAATNAVVEATTRNEIAEFSARHPTIANTLRRLNLAVTVMDGQPATMAQVEARPSQFRACPIEPGREDLVVQRVVR